jgi:hypothetical protein
MAERDASNPDESPAAVAVGASSSDGGLSGDRQGEAYDGDALLIEVDSGVQRKGEATPKIEYRPPSCERCAERGYHPDAVEIQEPDAGFARLWLTRHQNIIAYCHVRRPAPERRRAHFCLMSSETKRVLRGPCNARFVALDERSIGPDRSLILRSAEAAICVDGQPSRVPATCP